MTDLPEDVAPSARLEPDGGRMPRWVPRAIALFWLGQLITLVLRSSFSRLSNFFVLLLVAGFLSLAMEPAAVTGFMSWLESRPPGATLPR